MRDVIEAGEPAAIRGVTGATGFGIVGCPMRTGAADAMPIRPDVCAEGLGSAEAAAAGVATAPKVEG
jgi:hypothetical protein